MKKIKIVSNPYKKCINYKLCEDGENWVDYNVDHDVNSKLVGEKFKSKFFPFIVKDIVDEIIKEFQNPNELIEIEFEGTPDEYKELEDLCENDYYKSKVEISQSSLRLENARDILPNIIEYFKQMEPLINSSVGDRKDVQLEINKFTEASNDIIPICILGNYSSGKSTFINALIGNEILPSGGEPVTAKVFKIRKSKIQEEAYIKWEFDNIPFSMDFTKKGYNISSLNEGDELTSLILEGIRDYDPNNTTLIMNKTLEIINGFDNQDSERVSDLIEVSVPFVDGLWKEINTDFVIFDTPGSNSTSNEKHLEVLKNAMHGLTNGLPIFVSEYNALDSNDNEKLNLEIQSIEELDNRFTMIVVNKADSSKIINTSLVGEDKNRILNQAIPKSLYNEGIFFVSSILALGSKTKGNFLDDFCTEIYDDQKSKYDNKESKYYKTLYKFNIMPEQLMIKAEKECLNNNNLIYTNSGLFSVEKEIKTFSEKYSAYNKSMQSITFLDKVIKMTNKDIKDKRDNREKSRNTRMKALQKDKQVLVEKLNERFVEENESYDDIYPEEMKQYINPKDFYIEYDKLDKKDIQISSEHMEEKKYDKTKKAVEKRVSKRLDNTKNDLQNVIKDKNVNSLYKLKDTFIDSIKDTYNDYNSLRESKKEIQKDVSEEMLEIAKQDYSKKVKEIKDKLENESKRYWDESSQKLRVALREVINDSSALTEKKREELDKIITTYKDIEFIDKADDLFDKKRFTYKFKLGELRIIYSNKLNLGRLCRIYNSGISDSMNYLYKMINVNHSDSFDEWAQNLFDKVINNIEELSPALLSQVNIINEDTKAISELESKQRKLNEYTMQIKQMMEWKNN